MDRKQNNATHCNILPHITPPYDTQHHAATYCPTYNNPQVKTAQQPMATHYNKLQLTATQYNTCNH